MQILRPLKKMKSREFGTQTPKRRPHQAADLPRIPQQIFEQEAMFVFAMLAQLQHFTQQHRFVRVLHPTKMPQGRLHAVRIGVVGIQHHPVAPVGQPLRSVVAGFPGC